MKKVFYKVLQNLLENTCVGVSRPEAYNIIKKTSAQVFYCEICEIFKNRTL